MTTIHRDWHDGIVVLVRDRLPKVLFALLFLFLLQRVVAFASHRLQTLADRKPTTFHRTAQFRTLATILRATAYSILGFLAFLQLLHLFNINYAPLLASAGIVGVGIGLAAQSLFKDIINGIFILVEDQYNVGETVRIASLTGTVEDLTLRLTRLRDADGTLYVIPNSQIATVSNLSRDFAVATLPVSVDASVNPDRVIALLGEIARGMREDAGFSNVIVGEPAVPGVDKIDGRSITYPVSIKVGPTHRDEVLRELRRRIVLRFEAQGIPLGVDGSMLVMQAAKDPTAPPSQQPLL